MNDQDLERTQLRLEGQQLLARLRVAHGVRPVTPTEAVEIVSRPALPPAAGEFDLQAALTAVSSGQGYHSDRVTDAMRVALRNRADRRPVPMHAVSAQEPAGLGIRVPRTPRKPKPDPAPLAETIRMYPALAGAILKHEQSAPARIYILARALDQADGMDNQRGAISIADLRATIATKQRGRKLMTWKRLEQIIEEGVGLFWTVSNGTIWLHGPVKIAHALGVSRLHGRPVALPVSAFLETIQAARASLYAACLAGFGGKPVTRDTILGLTGVSHSSQRTYEERAGIEAQKQIAVGDAYSQAGMQDAAYEHGQAFELIDRAGRHGPKNRSYVAWQLPNSYRPAMPPLPKGRQRRINQQLTLFTEGEGTVDDFMRTFHPDMKAAMRAGVGYYPARRLGHADDCPPSNNGPGIWRLAPDISC